MVLPIIHEILKSDHKAPKIQRQSNIRILERPKAEWALHAERWSSRTCRALGVDP